MPAWFASIVHVPAATIVTVAPLTVQMPALPASADKVTGRPEVAVADTVYAGSPTLALPGAVEVKLIVCVERATAKDCCTCGAAR